MNEATCRGVRPDCTQASRIHTTLHISDHETKLHNEPKPDSAARYLGLSSSPWCRVWCYRGWTIATQYWPAFNYTLFGACSQWWTRTHGSSSRHQSAITSSRTYANYTGWRSLGG